MNDKAKGDEREELFLTSRGERTLKLLALLGDGLTLEEFADELDDVCARVMSTGEKGAVTLKLTVAPVEKMPVTALEFIDDVKGKRPRLNRQTVARTEGLGYVVPEQVSLEFVTGIVQLDGEIKEKAGA